MNLNFDQKTNTLIVDTAWTRHMLDVAEASVGIPFNEVVLVISPSGSVTLGQYDVPKSLYVNRNAKVTIMNANMININNDGGSIRITNSIITELVNKGQVTAYMSKLRHVLNGGAITASKSFFYDLDGSGMLRSMSSVLSKSNLVKTKSAYLNKTYLVGCKLPEPFISHPLPTPMGPKGYSADNKLLIHSLYLLSMLKSKLTDVALSKEPKIRSEVAAIEKFLYGGAKIPSCYADLLLTQVVFAPAAQRLLMAMPVSRNYVRDIIPEMDITIN